MIRRWMLVGVMLLTLAACGAQPTTSTEPSPTTESSVSEPAPTEVIADEPPAAEEDEAAPTNPLCELAKLDEVQAVIGGNITKIDVIDEPTLDNLSCVYLDSADFNKGLTISFVSTDRLVATDSKWPTAAAYFEEWGGSGEQVTGLGEGAAWVEITNTLDVLKGDTVVKFSSGSADTTDAAVRTQVENLAKQVVSRLP